MPGAYPPEMVNSQEKQDHFWNLRLGVLASLIPGLVLWVMVEPTTTFERILAISGAVYIWRACLEQVFLHNIFGRFMTFVMGPYTPDDK